MDSLGKLVSYGKKYSLYFTIALITMILEGFVSLMPSWLVKIAVDGLNMHGNEGRVFLFPKQLQELVGSPSATVNVQELLSWIPALIICVYCIDGVLRFCNQYYIKLVGICTVRDIRNSLHEKLQSLSVKQVTQEMSGTYVSRVTNDLLSVQHWAAQTLTSFFNDTSKALFLFGWLLCINYKLTLLATIVVPAFIFPVVRIAKRIKNLSKKGQTDIGTLGGFVQESLYNLRQTQAYNLEENRNKQFMALNDKLFHTLQKTNVFECLTSPITAFVGACGIAFVFWYGMKSVSMNWITLGDFSSFFLTTVLLYEPIKRISRIWSTIQQALGASEKVFEILEEESTLTEVKSAPKLELIKGHINFNNVSFDYGNGNKVLNNLNLEVLPGEQVAILGPSGVGKTTLISLIPRFYDPTSGKIEIDGIDVKSVNLASLRSKIALVTQDHGLYNCSIKENILVGKPNATEEEIITAAKKAHVLEFVEKFQDGFNTSVGEGGTSLSGGQRQRVALARAFLKDAPILILDEPTSHLDPESEQFVKDAIKELVKNRTVIIIAHKKSTIENSNKIVSFDHGGKISIESSLLKR